MDKKTIPDVEGNFIAILLQHPQKIYDVMIDKSFFGDNQHKAFFSIMEFLAETRDIDELDFDPPTLNKLCYEDTALKKTLNNVFKGKGETLQYLQSLKEFDVSVKNIDIYEEKLIKAKVTNKLINENEKIKEDIMENYNDYTKEEIIDKMENSVLKISNNYANKEDNIEHISEKTYQEYAERDYKENDFVGLPSPFPTVDERTKGILRPGSVSIFNAATGIGKSMVLKQIVKKLAVDYGKTVYWGANEMNKNEQKDRLLVEIINGVTPKEIETGIYNKPSNKKLKEKVMTGGKKMSEADIFFDKLRGFTPEQLVRRAKYFKKRYDIDVFVWDYIKLSSGKPSNEESRMYLGRIVDMMKENIADPLGIPIISASQSKTYEWFMPAESENIRRNCTFFASIKQKTPDEISDSPLKGEYKMYIGKDRYGGGTHNSPKDDCIGLNFDKNNLKFYEV